MTIARLLLEVHRSAATSSHDLPRHLALKRAAQEVLGMDDEGDFDVRLFDRLTPTMVLRLDMFVAEEKIDATLALRSILNYVSRQM